MISAIDRYLQTLLTFVPRSGANNRFPKDYVALIYVPANGPEKVYSLVQHDKQPVLTIASYREAVWELVDAFEGEKWQRPELEAIQAEVAPGHPALDFLDTDSLRACRSYSDGRAGLDYYLMLWQRDGESNVVECYEPYSRDDSAWSTVIGSLQLLSSQFEYAAR